MGITHIVRSPEEHVPEVES